MPELASKARQAKKISGDEIFTLSQAALRKTFTPEWLGRIDEIIAFRPLTPATLDRVLTRMLHEANIGYARQGISVTLTPSARAHLLRKGYDAALGARPLRARLLKAIDAPLADLLASGGIPHGSAVTVAFDASDGDDGDLIFFDRPDAALAAAYAQQAQRTTALAAQAGGTPAADDTPRKPPSAPAQAVTPPADDLPITYGTYDRTAPPPIMGL